MKLLVQEAGSDLAAELWDGCDAVVASRLAYPEVRAVLAAAGHSHDLASDGLAAAEQVLAGLWLHSQAAGNIVGITSGGHLAHLLKDAIEWEYRHSVTAPARLGPSSPVAGGPSRKARCRRERGAPRFLVSGCTQNLEP